MWIKKIIMKIRKSFELKDNKYATFQNLWNAGKAIVKEKCIALKAYFFLKKKLKIIVSLYLLRF